MAVRPGDKKAVVVSRIIDIGTNKPPVRGKAPVSEPPAGEKERLIGEVRFLLANASVAVSYVEGFDLKEFLDGMTFAKVSRQDGGIILVSGRRMYKFYIEDITSKGQTVAADTGQRIRLEDGDQVYYLFPARGF